MVVEDTVPKQTSEQWEDLTQLLDKFQTIFSQNMYDVGCINLEPQRIHLISGLPISLCPYRNSQQESKEIQTQIEEMLKAGFIRPSHSPYTAPVTLAYEKDERKRSRLCIDYRKLNEITRKDSIPVPLIDFVIDNLTHVKFFSTLDLTSGYWHIKIHEKDAEKLAFTTNFGLYEWCEKDVKINFPNFYFWKDIILDISNFVKCCETCQMNKKSTQKKYGLLEEVPVAEEPFEMMSLDTVGGFNYHNSQEKYLHIVLDHATRYAWTFPSKSVTSETYTYIA
ncbi:retrovirus-related Pol polyprotein from transposon gypsy [Trichonephila clavipes]|uniref:Retrovirus-related Pol polyprotein from transposon gypsy n=1 Tax=Trichonephila clavipes TaxID=2585209 RepID=A0A8X7BNA4_TRICX|nr:retrovirus-related Pol polyprotein from transposon gypsy [Trichonephila clavipes]